MGRKAKEFCIRGHNLSETRQYGSSGAFCYECKRITNSESNRKRVYNSAAAKRRSVKNLYNLSWNNYLKLNEQYSNCPICNVSFTEKFACVDHDKLTGKVRGLLCHNCNTGIGLLKHSKEVLIRAIEYLEESEKDEQNG